MSLRDYHGRRPETARSFTSSGKAITTDPGNLHSPHSFVPCRSPLYAMLVKQTARGSGQLSIPPSYWFSVAANCQGAHFVPSEGLLDRRHGGGTPKAPT